MVSLPFFFFKIPRLKALMLLNTGWPVSLNRCTILLAAESHSPLGRVRGFYIPLLFRSTGISSRNPWLFLHSKYKSHRFLSVQSMSLHIDMKTIRPVNSSGSLLFLFKSRWISWRICNDENHGKHATRIQLLLNRVLIALWKKDTSWILPIDLPILLLLLCFHSSVPHMELDLSRHVFLLLSTWSLDHETILISSMREMSSQAVSHSEFLRNVPILDFWVMLNKLSSKFVFLQTSRFAK